MTKLELQAALEQTETRLTEALSTIEAQANALSELPELREENSVLQQQIATLEIQLAQFKNPTVWDALAEGWLMSSIGKRALLTPGVDLTGFQIGVDRQNFKLVKYNYGNILEALKIAGVPATPAEQQEIGLLLQRLGFA